MREDISSKPTLTVIHSNSKLIIGKQAMCLISLLPNDASYMLYNGKLGLSFYL
jgi:hypothetical protein